MSTQPGVPLRLEVAILPVADVERAKQFYQGLGWRLDADAAGGDDFRVVQMTPPASQASIIFGKGVTSATPGSMDRLILASDDIEAARDDLIAHGVDVGEVFHDPNGGLGAGFNPAPAAHAAGPDPDHQSYASYASFKDPDGNQWMLQGITKRLPGREWT
jgi:catechol 2,3-dioxygenase-like lactoylglutathione lyase family enzyme